MTKRPNLLWITALVLGWLFDLLFWKQPFGINFGLYSLICLVAGLILLWIGGQRPARGAAWLAPLIAIFAVVTFIRSEPMSVFLGVVFTLLLLATLASTFLGGRWFWYGLADYFSAFLKLAGSMIARPITFSAEVRGSRAVAGMARPTLKIWPFVRGVVIAVPILAIFGSLLASADAVFGHGLNALLSLLAIQNLPEYIFRMAYMLTGAYFLSGVLLHASTQSRDEKLMGEDKPLLARFLGFTEAAIVLASVTVLFAAFVLVQFRYFFGGQANINVAGFTYADYARRGFGELVTVAFFSLFLILGLESISQRESSTQRRWFSGLSVSIVALVLVMLVSAYQRLVMYEAAYGFSRLRTYTHVALVWIGLLLVVVVVLEIVNRQRSFALAMLIASLGFALSLAVANVDGLIARENIQRSAQGEPLDVPYLVSLSSDAVPALVDAFNSSSTPAATRDAVGAVLFCRLRVDHATAPTDWQAFTFSRYQADAAFKRVQSKLDGYLVIDETWPTRVLTPAGSNFDCHGAGID